MKNVCISTLMLLLISGTLWSQERSNLSLKEAYAAIESQYPLLQTDSLLSRIYEKELTKLSLDRRPDIFLQVEGRVQSETVGFPDDSGIPLNIDLPLYSFKPYLQMNYTLYDGGMNQAQVKQQHADYEVERKSLEVEGYKLREQINQLFVAISLYRAQAALLEISQKDLEARRNILEAGVKSGVVLESEVSRLKVRELELMAQATELKYRISGSLKTLGDLTGIRINEQTALQMTDYAKPTFIPELTRPEQELFLLQKDALLQKEELLESQHRPRLQLFAQGGAGYPNPLNLFDNNLSPYAIAGLNFQWKLTDKKQLRHDREILFLRSKQIEKQKESFEFNLNARNAAYLSRIDNLEAQIEKDEEIAGLQETILSQLATQLENGIITSTDYLIQSNAELRARQNLELHKIQLKEAHLDFRTLRGADR